MYNQIRHIWMGLCANGIQRRTVVPSTRESTYSRGRILDVKCELYFKDLIIYGNPKTKFVIAWMKSWRSRSWSWNYRIRWSRNRFNQFTFSDGNKNEVRIFPRPQISKKLQRFLGLVNYFGDHSRDLATLTHRYEHSTRRRKKKENFNRRTISNTV